MSDFKQAVEEILAAKTAGGYCKGLGCLKDEATGKYLSCVECQTYRILAAHNKRLDEIAEGMKDICPQTVFNMAGEIVKTAERQQREADQAHVKGSKEGM